MAKTSQAIQKTGAADPGTLMEQVIAKGDLSGLTPEQRVTYYNSVCKSIGLNPLTKPFDFLELYDRGSNKTKVVLYGNKDCAAQLRTNRQISIYQLDEKVEEGGCLIVRAYARTPDGREDVDEGVVFVKGLLGDNYANARKRCITQAKRRVTLSICGLGFLDESEVDDVPNARRIPSPEAEATITEAEKQSLILKHKTSGLDQWKCTQESGSRQLAMDLIKVCDELEAKGVSDELMRSRLPGGVQSRKDLTAAQAEEAVKTFQHWLTTYNEVVEGGVVIHG